MNTFSGFPHQAVSYLAELRQNNNKQWFDEHRSDFDNFVMTPAREFVVALGEALESMIPAVIADPRVNRSIFRINRDTRFSKDKTPYKPHLAVWLWEGEGPRMENSGFYFHLEPPTLMLGVGVHIFPNSQLAAYREAVVNEESGPELESAIQAVMQADQYDLGGNHYKRVPRGFEKDHPRAELLMFNGLTASIETPIPEELYSPEIIDYCLTHYRAFLPIHNWLVEMIVNTEV